jgi:hypothetical protein
MPAVQLPPCHPPGKHRDGVSDQRERRISFSLKLAPARYTFLAGEILQSRGSVPSE